LRTDGGRDGFGSPCNDIRSYLAERDHFGDAIEWLGRAKTAPRYEPRHVPGMNLGRALGELRGTLH
jgi:hypothetical protein